MRKSILYGICCISISALLIAGCSKNDGNENVATSTPSEISQVENTTKEDSELSSSKTDETSNATSSTENSSSNVDDAEGTDSGEAADSEAVEKGDESNDTATELGDGETAENTESGDTTSTNDSEVIEEVEEVVATNDIPLTEKEKKTLAKERARYRYNDFVNYVYSYGDLPDADLTEPSYDNNGYYDTYWLSYYVADVTGDGEEELVVVNAGARADSFEAIYKFNKDTNKINRIFYGSNLHIYKNGWLIDNSEYQSDWGLDFTEWIYRYDEEKKEYVYVATCSDYYLDYMWDPADFPSKKDKDGDGQVYFVETEETKTYFDSYEKREKFVKDLMEKNEKIEIKEKYNINISKPIDNSFIKTILKINDKRADVDTLDLGAEYLRGTFSIYNNLDLSEDITFTEQSDDDEWEASSWYEKIYKYNGSDALKFNSDDYTFYVDYYVAIPNLYICGVAPGMMLDEAVNKLNRFGFYTSDEMTDDYTGSLYFNIGELYRGNMRVNITVENGVVTSIYFTRKSYVIAG